MSNIFKKIFRRGPSAEALIAVIENRELDYISKRSYLTAIIKNVNAKKREIGLRALVELCRISEDPLSDLGVCIYGTRDNVVVQEVINAIASLGLDKADVWNKLVMIAEDSSNPRAARSHARDICLRYHENRAQLYWQEKSTFIRTRTDAIDAMREKLESDTGSGRLLPPQ